MGLFAWIDRVITRSFLQPAFAGTLGVDLCLECAGECGVDGCHVALPLAAGRLSLAVDSQLGRADCHQHVALLVFSVVITAFFSKFRWFLANHSIVVWKARFFSLASGLYFVAVRRMRKLIARCVVAFVTFSMGMIVATVFRSPIPRVSSPPPAQPVESLIEIKPREVKATATDTKATQHADLYIGVETGSSPPSLRRQHVQLAKHGATTIVDLDLAESVGDQEVTLNFREDGEYRVLQRYRTSMSISMEGPHLDLIDWRHFDSPWVSLKALSSKRFRTLATDQMQSGKFPPTTNEEIVAEVRKRMETDRSEIVEAAKSCGWPSDGACFVSISSIYLRVQKRVRAGWTDVGLIELRIPMGC